MDDKRPMSDWARLMAYGEEGRLKFEALKRDAERYRWLRTDMACDFGDPWVVTRWSAEDNEPYALVGDELDAAIDAAMKESK